MGNQILLREAEMTDQPNWIEIFLLLILSCLIGIITLTWIDVTLEEYHRKKQLKKSPLYDERSDG